MKYQVRIEQTAEKQLSKLPKSELERLKVAVLSLADNPRPFGYKKLKGRSNAYRVRVGNYRIIYEINDGILLVLVIAIGHRKEIYE
ncbi:MAG: type II toxin-antitoxin system RelE family toxin [Spirosomataceae bacterium]